MRAIFLILCTVISIAAIFGSSRPESKFQFEPGDHITVKAILKENIQIGQGVSLGDAVSIVELLLTRPDLLDSGPIFNISQTSDYHSEHGSVMAWIGIVRGPLNGEGIHVFFRMKEGKWAISRVTGWIS